MLTRDSAVSLVEPPTVPSRAVKRVLFVDDDIPVFEGLRVRVQ
jgi:hypothetical protein